MLPLFPAGRRRRVSARFMGRIALVFALGLSAPAWAVDSLTLAEASRLALQHSPQLARYQWQLKAAAGRQQTANQSPGYTLEVEADNLVGTGPYQSAEQAEYTLSIASVIELGNQRESRTALVASSYALIQAEKKAKVLDVLGQVTRAYVAVLAQQQRLTIAKDRAALAKTAWQLTQQRAKRGAAPQADALRAKADWLTAKQAINRARATLTQHQLALTSLWGGKRQAAAHLQGDLFAFESVADFSTLLQRVEHTPAMAVFASKRRLREAKVSAARQAGGLDLGWSLGVSRLTGSDDTTLSAGLSIPLFQSSRQAGEVKTAQAELAALASEKRNWQLALKQQLYTAWSDYRQAVARVQQLTESILPLRRQALAQIKTAYRQGRDNYSIWLDARRELLASRQAKVNAAVRAHTSRALIEQLTATSMAATLPATHNGD